MESYQFESIKERLDILIQLTNKTNEILEGKGERKNEPTAATTTTTSAI